MIEVNNKNDYIRQALKEADRVLSVSKIVPTEFLKDFNDKLEGIIWRIKKDCMEQRMNILEQNDSLQVTCIPKESEVEKHREMFDLFLDVFEYIQVYQVEQCIAIAEETGEQCKWENYNE